MKFRKLSLALLFFLSVNTLSADFDEIDDNFGFNTELIEHAGATRGLPSIFAQFALAENQGVPSPERVLGIPLYKSTKPVRRRFIQDTAVIGFEPFYDQPTLQIIPFINLTIDACILENDKTIENYLDLHQGDVPEEIQELITDLMDSGNPDLETEMVQNFDNLQIPDVLGLFSKIKVHEKQLGFMLQYSHPLNDSWTGTIRAPFLWQIYHFYLTPEEQRLIEEQPLMQLFEPVDDFMVFARDHLISDKIGFGDMEIILDRMAMQKENATRTFGVSLGIPSALTLKKGAFGSYFNKKSPTPDFNLERDILQPMEAENIDTVKSNAAQLGIDALHRMASVLLDHPLSRDHHFYLGLHYKSSIDFTPSIRLASIAQVKCPLPASEYRFIRQPITQAEINLLKALPTDTDENAIKALNRYGELFLQKLFPQAYRCTIFPGVMFINTSFLSYKYNNWIFTVGSELWYQTQEHLMRLHVDEETRNKLDTTTVLNDYAFQSQAHVGITYHNKHSAWKFTLRASATSLTDRIGEGLTFSFNCERLF